MSVRYISGVLLALIALANVCQCANILYMSTTPSPSHHIWDKTLAMGLAGRNHKITFFTHSPEKKVDNFTPIVIEGMYDKLAESFSLAEWLNLGPIDSIMGLHEWMNVTCAYDLEAPALQTLLAQTKAGIKYDLIIMDMTTGHCLYPVIELFGSPPVIGTSPYGLVQTLSFPFGIDVNIAYNPLNFLPYTDHMSLFERAHNYVYTVFFMYWRQWSYLPQQQKLAEEFFGKDITPLDEIERTFSLLLTNTDPDLDYPQPVPPTVIQVGGLHTKRAKSLPEDLQKYLDQSKQGVIFFAFGTNIHAEDIGKKELNAFVKAFSQLKENVLWKFEAEIPNLPPNVMIRKWLPQNDILAHPNVKMFISHGGGLSTQEAMYHGVPVLGIPFFADQHVNMRKMAARKLGVKLDYKNITVQNLLSSIHEVIDNAIYKQNIQAVSKRYRDKPQNALERAIFWVEYVMRHGGTKHLQTAAKNMPFYQTWLLDIWGIVALAVLIVVYSIKTRLPNKRKQKVKKN